MWIFLLFIRLDLCSTCKRIIANRLQRLEKAAFCRKEIRRCIKPPISSPLYTLLNGRFADTLKPNRKVVRKASSLYDCWQWSGESGIPMCDRLYIAEEDKAEDM